MRLINEQADLLKNLTKSNEARVKKQVEEAEKKWEDIKQKKEEMQARLVRDIELSRKQQVF